MDIQDTKEQRQAFEAWCIQWNIASVFPLDSDGQYREYQIHLMYCAWLQGQAAIARMEVRINTLDEILLNQGEALAQAKAQAVPDGCVVVPKEPHADLVNHGHQVFLGHFNEGGQTGWRSLYFAYKAMIEAQEQAND